MSVKIGIDGLKMKNKKYHEVDRVLIPQYVLNMSDEETKSLMKQTEKRMNKMHSNLCQCFEIKNTYSIKSMYFIIILQCLE